MKEILINMPVRNTKNTDVSIEQIILEVGKDVTVKEINDKLILNLIDKGILYVEKEYHDTAEDYQMD